MKDDRWHVCAVTPKNSGEALRLIGEHFLSGSPLHQAVGMTKQEFKQYMPAQWKAALDNPLPALVAMNRTSQQIVGCLLPAPFPSSFDDIEALPDKRRTIALLLQQLENRYLPSHPVAEKSLMIDIAVVSESVSGQGIYQQMRRTFECLAVAHGYTRLFGALSSAATQRVCVGKWGHRVVAEVRYDEFTTGCETPFSVITDPASIQLAMLEL
jgi:hypothetical protein